MWDESFLIPELSAEALWLSMSRFHVISQVFGQLGDGDSFWSLSLESSSLITTWSYRKRNLAKLGETWKKKKRGFFSLFENRLNVILLHPYWNFWHVKFQRTDIPTPKFEKEPKNINLYLSTRIWQTPFPPVHLVWESPVKQFQVNAHTYMCVCTHGHMCK